MLHIIACDDEEEFLLLLKQKLKKHFLDEYSLVSVRKAEELEQILKKNPEYYDVLLMDIGLYKENGLDIAAQLSHLYHHLKIIFVTGFVGTYYETIFLKLRPHGVLAKPVDWEKLTMLLTAAHDVGRTYRHMLVKVHSGVMNIELDEVYYIESIKRIVFIHLKKSVIECYGSLTGFSQDLPENFLYCHKSFIVNMDYIKSFISREIQMMDGTVISVSKARLAEARKQYFIYIGLSI